MTKKTVFLIILFTILLGTNIVFADMGAPMIEPYTAVISNPEGAKYYKIADYENNSIEEVGKIDYNQEFEVNYEETINDVDYANIIIDDDYYYVKIDDIDIKDEKEFQGKIDTENKLMAKIIAKNGVEMYKGPAYAYSKVGVTIPFNEEIIGYREDEKGIDSWIYVNYKNQNGWINILDEKIGFDEKDEYCMRLFTYKKCNIYQDEEVVMEIPENTVIEDFLTTDQWSRSYYVTYNGVSGIVSCYDIAVQRDKFERYNTSKNEITLYKTGEENAEIAYQGPITEEEKQSLIVVYQEFDVRGLGWFYIRCNDKAGWINTDYSYDNGEGVTSHYKAKVTNTAGADYYKMESEESMIPAGKLEPDQEIAINYEGTHNNEKYSQYDIEGTTYYIKTSDLENINLKGANIPAEIFEKIKPKVEPTQTEETSQKETNTEEASGVETPQIVTICVVCAVVIFLMTIVIIMLVNKNKKQEKE